AEPLVDHVDPFLGTGGSGFNDIGSTYPGPARPFGMVHVGPDTESEGGAAPAFTHCSGFAHRDEMITGFSHMRMNGTGIPDYGNLALMPVPSMEPSFVDQEGYRARWVEGSREASVGYFAVRLERGDVQVELTSTERVALHRYTFGDGEPLSVLVDVGHRLADGVEAVDGRVTVDPDAREVHGFAKIDGGYSGRSHGGQTVYYVARFDRPFAAHGVWEGETLREGETEATGGPSGAWVRFDPADGPVVHASVGVSFVDVEGARANLDAEDAPFDEVRAETERRWEALLGRVRVEGRHAHDFSRFYTALYRVLLMPTLATDVDGRYRGLDDAVHEADGFTYYTDFSLWDTFRTLHPLLTLLYPATQLDMIRSLVAMAQDGGAMPRWPLGTGYTGGMVGDPAAMVLADSWVKGLRDFDLAAAYDALRRSAMGRASEAFGGRGNAETYHALGYVPMEASGGSVSETLEFAYADWALAILADALGETEDAATFAERAGSWRNQWDPERAFFVGRHEDGRFAETFREDRWEEYYTEGNAWQYLWYVPHDLPGLAEQMGGREPFLARLTMFFEQSARERRTALAPEWYWHGNEPDIHAPFIFTALDDPASGARWSRWVARDWYGDGPLGLPGNDDGGTLSAWLVFASMGLFTIAGQDDYLIGSPLFTRTELTLGDATFVIEAPDASDGAPIPAAARLDGEALEAFRVPHEALVGGGTLTLDMVAADPP
ncbi:MAG TPA: GH92 family glycosyl hydrolase, partial [Sandaracinaceae bacterium LLY-WYZ-13_1]|nr:GH92 family glycosyl hydrolase [Sandaracinaceae bacterium LLY-WYZ-13_1]